MNKPIDQSQFQTPTVTTGALPASKKFFTNPAAAPDISVAHRSIALHPSANEPDVVVYDTSGPYSDPSVEVDLEAGLARPRTAWVMERGNAEEYTGRDVKPEDNGGASGKYLAREFPVTNNPLRRKDDDKPFTQYEYARAGIITKEMIYVAERENLGRTEAVPGAHRRGLTQARVLARIFPPS